VAALDALDNADFDAPAMLKGYATLYLDVLRTERMCLCGMLAAEYQTLPERMQSAVIDFFNANERWLEVVIEQGQPEGTLRVGESATDIARAIVGGFEGPCWWRARTATSIASRLSYLNCSPGLPPAPGSSLRRSMARPPSTNASELQRGVAVVEVRVGVRILTGVRHEHTRHRSIRTQRPCVADAYAEHKDTEQSPYCRFREMRLEECTRVPADSESKADSPIGRYRALMLQ